MGLGKKPIRTETCQTTNSHRTLIVKKVVIQVVRVTVKHTIDVESVSSWKLLTYLDINLDMKTVLSLNLKCFLKCFLKKKSLNVSCHSVLCTIIMEECAQQTMSPYIRVMPF